MPSYLLRFLSTVSLGLALLLLAASLVQGQNQPKDPAKNQAQDPAKEKTQDKKAPDNLLAMIGESGKTGIGFLVVLGLFSLVMVAMAAERFVSLTRGRLMPRGFIDRLHQMTESRTARPEPFRELCEDYPSPIARILQAALLRSGRTVTEVEKAMEDSAARENAQLRAGVRPLNVIGSVAPLIGLLGTVVGMIIAFRTASIAGDRKGELLAEGIYLALLTTAAGLSIAIPAMLLAAYFTSRIDRFLREMDEQLMETIPCFALMEKPAHPERRDRAEHEAAELQAAQT